jgi:hypothetical protein
MLTVVRNSFIFLIFWKIFNVDEQQSICIATQ